MWMAVLIFVWLSIYSQSMLWLVLVWRSQTAAGGLFVSGVHSVSCRVQPSHIRESHWEASGGPWWVSSVFKFVLVWSYFQGQERTFTLTLWCLLWSVKKHISWLVNMCKGWGEKGVFIWTFTCSALQLQHMLVCAFSMHHVVPAEADWTPSWVMNANMKCAHKRLTQTSFCVWCTAESLCSVWCYCMPSLAVCLFCCWLVTVIELKMAVPLDLCTQQSYQCQAECTHFHKATACGGNSSTACAYTGMHGKGIWTRPRLSKGEIFSQYQGNEQHIKVKP